MVTLPDDQVPADAIAFDDLMEAGAGASFQRCDCQGPERALAQVEGWILGVPGLIRAGTDDFAAFAACDSSLFRLH
jgi:hypothetical protein